MKKFIKSNFYIFIGAIFILNCLILFLLKGFNFPWTGNLNQTIVKIDSSHIQLGNTTLHTQSMATYTLFNDGNNYLKINDVKVDCHCTVAKWEKEPIPPKQSTDIIISYDNHIPGFFKRVIQVEANVPHSPLVFTFSGFTKAAYEETNH